MSNQIKIVYNWIGPRGPIPNTEIPNIFNLASCLEKVTVDSHRYWADSIWHSLFSNRHNYTLAPSHCLAHEDTFIYPFNLTWRIPFTNYFYRDAGLLEYGFTPGHLTHLVRMHKGYFLIDMSAEAWVEYPHLASMHEYFDFHRIPLSKVIYLTGCMNANQMYDQWLRTQNITDPRCKMNIISYPVSQNALATYFEAYNPRVPDYDTERVPEKLFLSWNRRFRDHRIAVALSLNNLGLVERSYMSMGKTDPENSTQTVQNNYNQHYTTDIHVDIDNFVNKLPLVLDNETDNNRMCQDFDDATRPFYQNSLVSIVTETNYNSQYVTLTEKSFKPSKEKHPFIIVGAAGTLQAFRDMGFKTFSEFWNESYDNIHDPRHRMHALYNVFKDIGSWNNAKILDFRRRVKPILDHNYETLKIHSSKVVSDKIKAIVSKGPV